MIVNIVLEEIQKEILWAKRFCTEKNHDWSQSKWALYPAWFWILLLRNVVETAKQFRFDFRWLATILEFSWVIGFCGLKWTRMFGGGLFSSFPSSCHCLRTSAICSANVIVFAGSYSSTA